MINKILSLPALKTLRNDFETAPQHPQDKRILVFEEHAECDLESLAEDIEAGIYTAAILLGALPSLQKPPTPEEWAYFKNHDPLFMLEKQKIHVRNQKHPQTALKLSTFNSQVGAFIDIASRATGALVQECSVFAREPGKGQAPANPKFHWDGGVNFHGTAFGGQLRFLPSTTRADRLLVKGFNASNETASAFRIDSIPLNAVVIFGKEFTHASDPRNGDIGQLAFFAGM